MTTDKSYLSGFYRHYTNIWKWCIHMISKEDSEEEIRKFRLCAKPYAAALAQAQIKHSVLQYIRAVQSFIYRSTQMNTFFWSVFPQSAPC